VTPSAEQAREEAQAILDEGRFNEHEVPRPLRGVLEWLGDRLEGAGSAVDELLPGGENVVWLLLAAVTLLAAIAVGLRLARGRAPAVSRGPRGGHAWRDDPAVLEREADEAERKGDLERALRLRFRAGVLRLVERRLLDDPSSVTTGALVRRLRSEPFAQAASSFDEVIYGRRTPTQNDTRLAREGWAAVLAR
jgi:hypothetical protein